MAELTFRQITDRTHLNALEERVDEIAQELGAAHGCSEVDIAHALVCAAEELARRGEDSRFMDKSFSYHVIERCKTVLGRLRATYC